MQSKEKGVSMAFGSARGREKGTCMREEKLEIWNEFSQKQEIGTSPELTLIPGKMKNSWRRQRTEGLC